MIFSCVFIHQASRLYTTIFKENRAVLLFLHLFFINWNQFRLDYLDIDTMYKYQKRGENRKLV